MSSKFGEFKELFGSVVEYVKAVLRENAVKIGLEEGELLEKGVVIGSQSVVKKFMDYAGYQVKKGSERVVKYVNDIYVGLKRRYKRE